MPFSLDSCPHSGLRSAGCREPLRMGFGFGSFFFSEISQALPEYPCKTDPEDFLSGMVNVSISPCTQSRKLIIVTDFSGFPVEISLEPPSLCGFCFATSCCQKWRESRKLHISNQDASNTRDGTRSEKMTESTRSGDVIRRPGIRSTCGPISPESGRDCVKSLWSPYIGLYP